MKGVVVAKVERLGHVQAVVLALVICQKSGDNRLAGTLNKVGELRISGLESLQRDPQQKVANPLEAQDQKLDVDSHVAELPQASANVLASNPIYFMALTAGH